MNKTVLVTGASRGIGKAIALKFSKNNYNVIINANKDINGLLEVRDLIHVSGGNCYPVLADISNYQAVRDMLEEIKIKYPKIDVLVNNAAIAHYNLLTDTTVEKWHHIINTNLSSVYYLCHELVPDMVKNQSGSIINISSIWGQEGASMEVAYSASKGGLNAFTQALAKELGPSRIRVNAIACGVIKTAMNSWLNEEDEQALLDAIPLCQLGTPDQVADLTFFLANDTSSYLTGEIIRLSGGY